jgi:hypothetical protein
VKHNKNAPEDSGLSQFAPKIQAEAPVEAPAPVAENKISDQTQEKIQKKLNKELKDSGEKQPSDITQALADSQDFGDVGSAGEPTGFFGKYLKKHRDMKQKVQD